MTAELSTADYMVVRHVFALIAKGEIILKLAMTAIPMPGYPWEQSQAFLYIFKTAYRNLYCPLDLHSKQPNKCQLPMAALNHSLQVKL